MRGPGWLRPRRLATRRSAPRASLRSPRRNRSAARNVDHRHRVPPLRSISSAMCTQRAHVGLSGDDGFGFSDCLNCRRGARGRWRAQASAPVRASKASGATSPKTGRLEHTAATSFGSESITTGLASRRRQLRLIAWPSSLHGGGIIRSWAARMYQEVSFSTQRREAARRRL